MRKYKLLWIVLLIVAFGCQAGQEAWTAAVPRMTKEDLKSRLESNDIIVVDVRTDRDWASSTSKIKGAIRKDPAVVDSWVDELPQDKILVLYCA